MYYDVVIIGAGVVGALTAREFSKYNLKICLIDRESDVAMGTSKANSAIVHAGYDAKPGSMKAKLNVRGNVLMEKLASELDVPFKRIGSLVLAFDEDERAKLGTLYDNGVKNSVPDIRILDGNEVKSMEPNISDSVIAALYAPTAAITCPYELTVGAVENAVENGVDLKLECEVTGIRNEGEYFKLITNECEIQCRYIVNAAGLFSDSVASMAGDDSFSIKPRKGEYLLMDKKQGSLVGRVIFQMPSGMGKGILVTPTVDGNILIGPNAENIDDRNDVSTTQPGLEQVIAGAMRSVPDLKLKDVITSFAGLRSKIPGDDFVIEVSKKAKGLINAVGIDSPGLSAAPAIAEYIAGILKAEGLDIQRKDTFNPYRRHIYRFREMNEDEIRQLVLHNPAYGKIVCRCEMITEGEIIDCIKRPAGARNLDAVKRRTRAGMGRCQGGFCVPRVVEILSRELGIPMEQVTKKGGNSWMLSRKTK